ncbi:MAG: APC family permease [Streptosporangiaceae bacterium]
MTDSQAIGLKRNAIGLREILFQSITSMAPGAAISASIIAGASYAGGSLPLALIVALIASVFTAIAIGELAARFPSAGSLATYVLHGLHPGLGFLVGWGYVLVEALLPPLLFLQIGFVVTPVVHSAWSSWPASLWWPWSVLAALLVAFLVFLGVQTSARAGTILGVFEGGVFLVLAVMFIIHAGQNNTASVFTAAHIPQKYAGFAGIAAGSVYTVLAFTGFEAATPLAEESRNPRRNVRLALVGSAIGIGLLYLLATYAVDVVFGPDKFADFGVSGAASWIGLTKSVFGLAWVFIFFAIVNSCIANANAATSASTRMGFALGRANIFPRLLAAVHPRFRSPYVMVFVNLAVALGVTLGFGLKWGPVNGFDLTATIIVLIDAAIYIVVDAACIGYFWFRRRGEFNVFLHLIAPVIGIVVFIPAWIASAGLHLFSFVAPLTSPSSYAGVIAAAYMVIGLAYLLWLARTQQGRQRVTAMGIAHYEAEPAEPTSGPFVSGA